MRIFNESEKSLQLSISDSEGQINKLLSTIQHYTSIGHSFKVVVDPDDSEYERSFYIDGDGSDKIFDIEVILEDENNK